MNTHSEPLQIEIEEVDVSKLGRTLVSLNIGVPNQTLRFVGRVGGETLYRSGSFSSNHPVDPMNLDEAYAPRMAQNLAKLREEIEADGWVETAQGSQSWALTFVQPASD